MNDRFGFPLPTVKQQNSPRNHLGYASSQERMLRLEKELECNAAEQSDAYRMHSSARPSVLLEANLRFDGAGRFAPINRPVRSLECSYRKLPNGRLEPWGDVEVERVRPWVDALGHPNDSLYGSANLIISSF